MPKLKHSKYKNTYLLCEFLIRQSASEVLNGIKLENTKSFKIIKEHLTKGVLKKELELYDLLINENLSSRYTAENLINEVLKYHDKIPNSSVKSAKYALVKEIKKYYDVDQLFSWSIPDYKEAATAYMLFESQKRNVKPIHFVKYKGTILENMLSNKKTEKKISMLESLKGASKSDIKLAFNIIVNKFNKEFQNKLNENQIRFINQYIESSPEDRSWLNEHFRNIKTKLNESIKMFDSNDTNEKIIKVKLKECKNTLSEIETKHIVNENEYVKLLSFYKLFDDINNVKKHGRE